MLKAAVMAVLFGTIAAAPAGAQISALPAMQGVRAPAELIATSHTSARKAKRATKPATAQAPPRPVWTGPDPTKGPGTERLRQLQREGRCVIDEGYGRFTFCTNH